MTLTDEQIVEKQLNKEFERVSLKAQQVALMGVIAHLTEELNQLNNDLVRLENK